MHGWLIAVWGQLLGMLGIRGGLVCATPDVMPSVTATVATSPAISASVMLTPSVTATASIQEC